MSDIEASSWSFADVFSSLDFVCSIAQRTQHRIEWWRSHCNAAWNWVDAMQSHNIFHAWRFGSSMPGRSAVLPCFDSIMFGSSEMWPLSTLSHVNKVRYVETGLSMNSWIIGLRCRVGASDMQLRGWVWGTEVLCRKWLVCLRCMWYLNCLEICANENLQEVWTSMLVCLCLLDIHNWAIHRFIYIYIYIHQSIKNLMLPLRFKARSSWGISTFMAEMLEVRLTKPHVEKHGETTSPSLIYPMQLHSMFLGESFLKKLWSLNGRVNRISMSRLVLQELLFWKSPVNPLAGIIDTRLHVFSTLPRSALWWSSMNWARMPSAKPCRPCGRICTWLAVILLLGTKTLGDFRMVKDSHSPQILHMSKSRIGCFLNILCFEVVELQPQMALESPGPLQNIWLRLEASPISENLVWMCFLSFCCYLGDVTLAHKSVDFCHRTPDASHSLPLTSTSWQLWNKPPQQCGTGDVGFFRFMFRRVSPSMCLNVANGCQEEQACDRGSRASKRQAPSQETVMFGGIRNSKFSRRFAMTSRQSTAPMQFQADIPLCPGRWSCRSKLWPLTWILDVEGEDILHLLYVKISGIPRILYCSPCFPKLDVATNQAQSQKWTCSEAPL